MVLYMPWGDIIHDIISCDAAEGRHRSRASRPGNSGHLVGLTGSPLRSFQQRNSIHLNFLPKRTGKYHSLSKHATRTFSPHTTSKMAGSCFKAVIVFNKCFISFWLEYEAHRCGKRPPFSVTVAHPCPLSPPGAVVSCHLQWGL